MSSFLLLQDVPTAGFLPDGLNEWLGAIVALLTITGIFTGIVQRIVKNLKEDISSRTIADIEAKHQRERIEEQVAQLQLDMKEGFQKQGRRIGGTRAKCAGTSEAIAGLRSEIAGFRHMLESNSKEATAADTKVVDLERRFEAAVAKGMRLQMQAERRFSALENVAKVHSPPLEEL